MAKDTEKTTGGEDMAGGVSDVVATPETILDDPNTAESMTETDESTAETSDESTALETVAAPFAATWRVLQNDRVPAYLVAGGLVVMGVIDPPLVVGGLIFFEALRRIRAEAT